MASTSEIVGGIVSITVDGDTWEAEGSVEVDLRTETIEVVAGLNGLIRKVSRRVPTMKANLIAVRDLKLSSFWASSGYTVQVDDRSGVRHLLFGASVNGDAPFVLADGTVSVEWQGTSGKTEVIS